MSLKNRRKRDGRRGQDRNGAPPDYRPGGTYSTGGGKRGSRRGVAGPIIIICAVIAVLVAADYWVNSGKIHHGVEVGNVSLGGKTPTEARQIVEDRAMGPLKQIEFSGPEHFTRSAGEMGVSFNVDQTVDKAYAVGREGNLLDRFSQRLRASFGGVTIPPNIDYQPAKARAEVRGIAEQVNHQPREADVKVNGSEVEVAKSRDGYELNPAATMASVDRAVDGMSGKARLVGDVLDPKITTTEAETAAKKVRAAVSEQLVFKAQGKSWTLSPADVSSALDVTKQDGKIDVGLNRDRLDGVLTNVYNDLTIKPVEASYDFDAGGNVIVKPSHEGQSVEGNKLLDAVQGGLFQGKREYQVSTTVAKPQYTTAELQAKKPTQLLGTYKTNYTATTDQSQERVDNLGIASNAISGTFLAPGQVFSMNDTVSGLKYNKTHVIVDGKETTADGGGLCQVTSTLYNAALYAGLEVVDRHPHYSQLPYIRPGMDATVWFGDQYGNGALDMKFKNTTDGYVLLQESVGDDNYIYASVYGVPDNVDVQMSSEPVYKHEDASEWITYYKRTENGKTVYKDQWTTDYSALIDEKGKKIPTPIVPVAEIDGTYNGPAF